MQSRTRIREGTLFSVLQGVVVPVMGVRLTSRMAAVAVTALLVALSAGLWYAELGLPERAEALLWQAERR